MVFVGCGWATLDYSEGADVEKTIQFILEQQARITAL
jgi:hypothetical protein